MKKALLYLFAAVGVIVACSTFMSAQTADGNGHFIACEAEDIPDIAFYLEKGGSDVYSNVYVMDEKQYEEVKESSDKLAAYIRSVNPGVEQSVIDMIPYYIIEGKREGIRGDLAFAQSCLETGNFTFRGSAVTLDQNNFGGLGVTRNGETGSSYDTPQLGIRAQIQHLKAYANKEPLVSTCVDDRFSYVTRGSAPYIEWLGIQENPNHKGWAAGAGYGSKILQIMSRIEDAGSNVTDEEDIVAALAVIPEAPNRDGMAFAGWMDKDNKIYDDTYEVEKDLSLHAVWYVDVDS